MISDKNSDGEVLTCWADESIWVYISIRYSLTILRVFAFRNGFKSVAKIYEIRYISKMNNSDMRIIIVLRSVVIKIVIIIITMYDS